MRAGMVERAEDWPWSSFHVRRTPGHDLRPLLGEWPIDRPSNWSRWVNQPQTPAEEEAAKLHIQRSRPMGDPEWVHRTAKRLGLENTLRSTGRQKGWRKPREAKK